MSNRLHQIIEKRDVLLRDMTICSFIGLLFFLPDILRVFEFSWSQNKSVDLRFGTFVQPLLWTISFLFNYIFLTKWMLINRRQTLGFIGCNLLLLLLLLLCFEIVPRLFAEGMPFENRPNRPPHFGAPEHIFNPGFFKLQFVIREVTMFILSVAIAVSIRMTYYNQETRRREIEISAERRKIELMGLKAQLNPHFLFNTLNNIYSLISISPERAQKAVHDLSTMLRYMIYETSSATVPLKREMSFIIDYIELMKLRLSKSFNLTVDINTNFVDDHQIAPLLFLTFIENAFKHSIKAGANAFISIHIYMKDDEVICEVANSFSDTSNEDKDDKGIGLQNVRQQLNMIYPDRHSLSIDSDNNVYKVTLKILLNQ